MSLYRRSEIKFRSSIIISPSPPLLRPLPALHPPLSPPSSAPLPPLLFPTLFLVCHLFLLFLHTSSSFSTAFSSLPSPLSLPLSPLPCPLYELRWQFCIDFDLQMTLDYVSLLELSLLKFNCYWYSQEAERVTQVLQYLAKL